MFIKLSIMPLVVYAFEQRSDTDLCIMLTRSEATLIIDQTQFYIALFMGLAK